MAQYDAPESENTLRVEVSVRCGDSAGAQLTTVVDVHGWQEDPKKARGKLTAVVDLLLGTLPVEQIRGMENRTQPELRDVCITEKGELALVPKNWIQAAQLQAELRKKFPDGHQREEDKSDPEEGGA
jgi:hypothetical protein